LAVAHGAAGAELPAIEAGGLRGERGWANKSPAFCFLENCNKIIALFQLEA
jgi:hypothetical protein